jgi:hypothetical protein
VVTNEPALDPPPVAPSRPTFETAPDRERRNPFYRWLMHLGLPLVLSVVIHVGVFTGAALKTFAVLTRTELTVEDYEAGLVESPEDRLDEAFQWAEDVTLTTPDEEKLDQLDLSDFSRVNTFDESALTAGEDLGAGEGEGLGLGEGRFSLLGIGSGASEAGEGGFGSGMGGRGGQLGRAGVWGVQIQANRIVYVVDFSGSIIVAVDDLKRELKRSISDLKPSQAFNVIIFYSEGTGSGNRFKSESFESQLQPATTETRRRFYDWLDKKSPRGETEPLQSIQRALAMRPDAIFFFSDGYFDDSIVDQVTQANRAARARIVCFVFDEILLGDMSGLPRETDGARRLRRIAEENRGVAKIVTGKDLGRH